MNNKKFEQKIKKTQQELEKMKSQKFAPEVINAQEKLLAALTAQLEQMEVAKKGRAKKPPINMALTFSVMNEEEGILKREEQDYKIAFVKHNRPINKKKVNGFIPIIANGKYEEAYPIIATQATTLVGKGYEVTNVEGNSISAEDAKGYIVILDGQHRSLAFLHCNTTEKRVVPNTHIKEIEDVGAYLVDINDVGTSWSQKDRFAVAALVSDEELAQEISERINEGFSPTTASLIYTGKKITDAQVKKLLRGEEWKLPEGAELDIERGNRFIQLCKEASIGTQFITKRYFINGFNAHAISVGDEIAFDHLNKLKEQTLTPKKLREIKDDRGFIKMLVG